MSQRNFIRKIYKLSYWDQLKRLSLYSLQRRRERYMVIYVSMLSVNQHSNSKSAVKQVLGPKLFNVLPHSICNMTGCSKEDFNRKLDKFVCTVPDEPLITGYTYIRRTNSNSLLDMLQYAKISNNLVYIRGGARSWYKTCILTVFLEFGRWTTAL